MNHEEIRNLVKCLIEEQQDFSRKVEEPFERYTHELRMQWHKDVQHFENRLIRGYETLLEHIENVL